MELLVATALTLFVMVILSEAFATALEAFRQLKAIGDLQEKLRTTATIMRADLKKNYLDFQQPDGVFRGDQTVSFMNPFEPDGVTQNPNYIPPTRGFFRLWQSGRRTTGPVIDATAGSPIVITSPSHGLTTGECVKVSGVQGNTNANGTFTVTVINADTFSLDSSSAGIAGTGGTWLLCEGTDPEAVPSIRMINSTQNILHFSIKLKTEFPRPEDYLLVPIPHTLTVGPPALRPGAEAVFPSRWGEVAYFLGARVADTSATRDGQHPGLPLYALYRRVLVCANNSAEAAQLNTAAMPTLPRIPFGKPVTDATNATPIVITSAGHGLTGGDTVTVTGAQGNTAANGIFTVTVVNPDQFSLDGSSGNGAYTAGSGRWTRVPYHDIDYFEVSCKQDPTDPPANTYLYFNGPEDLTIPERRFGMDTTYKDSMGNPLRTAGTPVFVRNGVRTYPTIADQVPSAGYAARVGDDILLNGVVSFTVRLLIPQIGPEFVDLSHPTLTHLNSAITALNARAFDTWTSVSPSATQPYDYTLWNTPNDNTTATATKIPLKVRVVAVEIVLRVWDHKAERTRQITIIQEL